MAIDYYMLVDDGKTIKGESQVSGLPAGSFELRSWSWGMDQATTIGSATSGASAGKVQVNAFTISKTIDQGTPSLVMSCCSGQHFGTITITVRKAGGGSTQAQQPYLIFTFTNCMVTSLRWESSDESPQEVMSFVFAQFKISYAAQKPDGSLNSPNIAGWDITKNTKV